MAPNNQGRKKTMVQNERKEEEEDGLFLDLAMEKYVMQYRSLFLCPTDKREREKSSGTISRARYREESSIYKKNRLFFLLPSSSLLVDWYYDGFTWNNVG